jgi:hypothetical protein
MLEEVDRGLPKRRLVEGGHVPEVQEEEPQQQSREGVREAAQRALERREPAGDRSQDDAREAEKEKGRGHVPDQEVLEHVRREEVVLAQAVDGRCQSGEQRQEGTAEGEGL